MIYDSLSEHVEKTLEVFSLEELLETCDITVYELVLRLVEDGTITLPNIEAL